MEQSGCGDECRWTANFYEALRCYELLGLADVERIPVSQAPSPVTLKSATVPYRTACCRHLTDNTQKKTKTENKTPLFPITWKDQTTCRNICIWSSREGSGWPVSRHEHLDSTSLRFRDIGHQGDLLADLLLHVFTYYWFEMASK